jgi:hypothetical protein
MRDNGLILLILSLLAACCEPTCARAQDGLFGAASQPSAEFYGEVPDFEGAPAAPVIVLPNLVPASPVNLLLAVHKTAAARFSDSQTSGKRRRKPVARLIRSRIADDANFTNRTRFLAHRMAEMGRPVSPTELGVATTGDELLEALVRASQKAPIANLVIYGHAASNALFAREDRGFYRSVAEVAKSSQIVSGTEDERDGQLRAVGARDLADFENLRARGEIRFTRNPVIVFAGCGVAGKHDIDPGSIAARMAELLNAKVIASIDVTDQSMGRGRDFRNKEYSRRTWVRFRGGDAPERLNTRWIDTLQQLSFEGEVVASGTPYQPGRRDQN